MWISPTLSVDLEAIHILGTRYEIVHPIILDISVAPLQVHYNSESLPTTVLALCRTFTPKRPRQLWVKDLPNVPTWRLEWDSNPRPPIDRNQLYQCATTHHNACSHILCNVCSLFPLIISPWIVDVVHKIDTANRNRVMQPTQCTLSMNINELLFNFDTYLSFASNTRTCTRNCVHPITA